MVQQLHVYPLQTDDNETEKADSTKDEKEKLTETAANRNLGDRIASFFRINKSFNMDDEKTDAEKKTNENEVKEVITWPLKVTFSQIIVL